MLPAKGTDRIHDSIHLPEGHTVHPLVQILKGNLDGIGVGIIALVVIGEGHLQDGMGIAAVVRWVFFLTLGQFTRNYTQTVKRAADNKRRYAPGWVHSTCLLRGFPKGAAPIWHTTLRSKV